MGYSKYLLKREHCVATKGHQNKFKDNDDI